MIRLAGVMLWLSLGVIVAWAAPIYLHACSKTTCQMGEGLVDSDILAPNIRGIVNSLECKDKCAIVDYGTGQAHVMGHWLDIGCRAWGGSPCMWDRKAYNPEMLKGLMEDRYRE